MPNEEIIVIVSVSGGVVQDIATLRKDIPNVKVIVVDHDNIEAGDPGGYVNECAAIEDWSRDPDDSLSQCKSELPDDLVAQLDIPDPTRYCEDCGRKLVTYMKDLDGTNLEERYGCSHCETVVE